MRDLEQACREVAANYIDPENFLDQLVEDPGDINAQKNIAYLIDQHTTAILSLAQRIQREERAECGQIAKDIYMRGVPPGNCAVAAEMIRDRIAFEITRHDRATPPTEGKAE